MSEEDIEEIVDWCIVEEEHIPEFVKDTKELIRKVIKKNIRQAKQEEREKIKENLCSECIDYLDWIEKKHRFE